MSRPRVARRPAPAPRSRRAVVAACLLLSVTAGCGGSKGSAGSTPASSATKAPASAVPAPTTDATPLPTLPARTDASLVVIGDATSNENSEWVNVLGRQLSRSQHVRVQRVDQDDPTRYLDPVDFGDGEEVIDVWNDSTNEPKALDAASAAKLLPANTNMVLISRGRGADANSITGDLDRTLAAVRSVRPKASVAVVLQPDDGDSTEALTKVSTWAGDRRLPVIDVAGAFARTNDQGALLDGDGQPTDAGRTLWAEVVAAEIWAG